MVPVMCNCANNRIGVCYGNVNTVEIEGVMQVVDHNGARTTPSGTTMFDPAGNVVSSTACPGYIPMGSAPYAGVEQGGVKINQEGKGTAV